MENDTHFDTLFERVGQLRSRYLRLLSTFTIYDQFKRMSAPNLVGKRKAENAVKIMSSYRYFFVPIQEATRVHFFIELAKFFDADKRKQSLTLPSILDYSLKHLSHLTVKDFLEFQENRPFIPDILNGYKPLNKKDVLRFKRRLHRNKSVVSKLKTYRDKDLVHDDLKKEHVPITAGEVKILLKIIQDVIELFYRKLDFASNSYKNFNEEPKDAVNRVIEALQEHERERIRKIYKKYGIQ